MTEQIYKLYGIDPNTQPIGVGVEATVYPLGDERVVRVYRQASESQKPKLESIQSFYNSLDTSAVNFDVPKILSIDVGEGVVSTVDKKLHGQDFSTIYDSLNLASKQKYLLSYISTAQQIRHLSPPYPYFGEILADNPIRESTWIAFLSKKMQLALKQGQIAFSADLPEIQQVLDFMESKLSFFNDVNEANLVHGDFYVTNVLMENEEVSAVLDFNDLTLAGDFRMDIASAVIFLGDKGTGARDADREIIMDELTSQYGESIKDVVYFYKLYYALVFASYAKDSDPSTYRWAINTLQQQIKSQT